MLRYLAAFGPASAADAQTWSGLQGLAPVFDALRPHLLVFKGESGRRELFDLPDAPRPGEDVAAPARFLPEFDNLVLAHADRSRLVADEHRGALVTKNLRVRAAFLWDGMVAGTWEVQRRRGAVTLVMTPFRALPARASKALSAEGEALLRFAADDATVVRRSDHAGVRPWRRMTSPIAARSGGPPADAASTSLISVKYEGPKRPGLMIARNLASSLPWFAKPCTTPRGMQMLSPGPTSLVSPSTVYVVRPLRP